jgi:hypothetical protein
MDGVAVQCIASQFAVRGIALHDQISRQFLSEPTWRATNDGGQLDRREGRSGNSLPPERLVQPRSPISAPRRRDDLNYFNLGLWPVESGNSNHCPNCHPTTTRLAPQTPILHGAPRSSSPFRNQGLSSPQTEAQHTTPPCSSTTGLSLVCAIIWNCPLALRRLRLLVSTLVGASCSWRGRGRVQKDNALGTKGQRPSGYGGSLYCPSSHTDSIASPFSLLTSHLSYLISLQRKNRNHGPSRRRYSQH